MLRPPILFPLFSDITVIPGIGSKLQGAFQKCVGSQVMDVLFHLPVGVIDRRHMPPIFSMEEGQVVTTVVKVIDYHEPAVKSKPFKVICSNETGQLTIVFFHAYPDYIKRQLPLNQMRVLSGKIERFGQQINMVHPDYIVPLSGLEDIKKIEAVYPMTAGIGHKILHKAVQYALSKLVDLPDWHDPALQQREKWPSWKEALTTLHTPKDGTEIDPNHPGRIRLAYDELLASQLSLRLARKAMSIGGGESVIGTGVLCRQLREALPFSLTQGQEEVLAQIQTDQQSDTCMLRLLQGDVGSGKTVVALFAMLHAIEAGKQAALMAPTEILARQHYQWIRSITQSLPIEVAFLGASVRGKERTEILKRLASGEIHLAIGTHALFQEKVLFKALGIAIIDEQHRFGVNQRMAFSNKGTQVDTLLMTATPIPRTLTLAMYGDMECSWLKTKPVGRKPIDTRVMSVHKEHEIMSGFKRVIERGERVYWICPLIEESEKLDLAAAQERFVVLNQLYPGRVGLVHGKIPPKDREVTMQQFKEGTLDILVATTVIEVGVDVPEATVMVIEHAERFGLSQLHQLRGRVGRGSATSVCLLLYEQLNPVAKERLQAIRNSNDGFWLAEEDLRLRGGGEMLGTKQSGLPNFKCVDFSVHHDLLKMANQDARLTLQHDPELKTGRGEALRLLLHVFSYDTHMRYLRAG